MIYILHGEDLPSARNFILNLQKQNNITVKREFSISDEGVLDQMRDLAQGTDMFGESLMAVFDVSKAGRANVDEYVEFLKTMPDDFLFVILSSKELTGKNAFIKGLGGPARSMVFKGIPKSNVFKFVDAVFDQNRVGAYKELQRLLLVGEDAVYLLTMLEYGLRSIAYAKFESPQFHKLSPFVKSKVKRQSEKFTEEQILSFYQKFYELDRDLKFGRVSPEVTIPIAVESLVSGDR